MSDFDNEFVRGDTPRVEVLMSKFLSLAVMCSLAFPAMALAQETAAPEAPKQAADDMDKEYDREEPSAAEGEEQERYEKRQEHGWLFSAHDRTSFPGC